MNENAWLGVTNRRGKGVVSMYHCTPSGQSNRKRNGNGNRGGIRSRSERGSRSGNRSDFKDKKQSNSC